MLSGLSSRIDHCWGIDDQVKQILSKSHLPVFDVERIWQLTSTIDAEGLPNGGWTRLEVYVALHFVQKFENLNLDQMAVQFAGPIQLGTHKITRRSSYAQAGSFSNSRAASHVIQATPSAALLRTQSLAETSALPTARLLRHSRSDASASVGSRGTIAHQTLSDHDNSSVSQAGLEAMDPIAETESWGEQRPSARLIHRNYLHTTESLEAISRGSSIRTDTVGRAERLASLIQTRTPEVTIGPVIETAGPWTRQASTYDRTLAHDNLVRIRVGHPKFKDPAAGLGRLLKSKRAKGKASNKQIGFSMRKS